MKINNIKVCATFCIALNPISCWAMRDLFAIDQHYLALHPLKAVIIDDLTFLGAIILQGKQVGFISDPLGNVYNVTLGQCISELNFKIINILNDKILLSNGQRFVAIK